MVLLKSALLPLAVLLSPVVLEFRAPEPNAVLDAIAPAPLPTRTPDRVASVVEEIAPVTANAPEFTAASVEVPDADSVVNAPVDGVEAPTVPLMLNAVAVPVMFVPTRAVGVPNAGVTSVGEVANTATPVPVSSVNAVASCAEVKEPNEVALPTEVTAPVRLALVVTLPAVRPAAVPVMFVPTRAEGVPSAGVTNVGDVDITTLPVPVMALDT